MKSTIELKRLAITPSLGTYRPGDIKPDCHFLDLIIGVDPKLVMIDTDGMDYVFDYNPLILEIDSLAKDTHYETQERLITRIVVACAAYEEIETIEIFLSKKPVLNNSGELGLRLLVEDKELNQLRRTKNQLNRN